MSPVTAIATLPAELRARDPIASWLLDGPVQLVTGPHSGAVVGGVDADGHPTFVYPEIAGYFLQWLAWRSRNGDFAASLVPRAEAVQRWLATALAFGNSLPTRLHLQGSVNDWRNQAQFCFDLAMVLRGVSAATNAGLLVPDARVVAGIASAMERLIAADGMFDAYSPPGASVKMPLRWSTRRGGFLAKAAAGVIVAATLPGMSTRVVAAAEASWLASVDAALDTPHDELHAQLYAFEGILSLPQHPRTVAALPQIAAAFDSLLELGTQPGSTSRGALPERRSANVAAPGPERVDVIAQMLRVGHLLQRHLPAWLPDRVALARLRNLLVEQIRANGSVPFAIADATPSANVWAAMFADQALAFALPSRLGDADLTDPLIV